MDHGATKSGSGSGGARGAASPGRGPGQPGAPSNANPFLPLGFASQSAPSVLGLGMNLAGLGGLNSVGVNSVGVNSLGVNSLGLNSLNNLSLLGLNPQMHQSLQNHLNNANLLGNNISLFLQQQQQQQQQNNVQQHNVQQQINQQTHPSNTTQPQTMSLLQQQMQVQKQLMAAQMQSQSQMPTLQNPLAGMSWQQQKQSIPAAEQKAALALNGSLGMSGKGGSASSSSDSLAPPNTGIINSTTGLDSNFDWLFDSNASKAATNLSLANNSITHNVAIASESHTLPNPLVPQSKPDLKRKPDDASNSDKRPKTEASMTSKKPSMDAGDVMQYLSFDSTPPDTTTNVTPPKIPRNPLKPNTDAVPTNVSNPPTSTPLVTEKPKSASQLLNSATPPVAQTLAQAPALVQNRPTGLALPTGGAPANSNIQQQQPQTVQQLTDYLSRLKENHSSLSAQIEHLTRMLAGIGPGEAAKEAAVKGEIQKISERRNMVASMIQKSLLQIGQMKGDVAGIMAAMSGGAKPGIPNPAAGLNVNAAAMAAMLQQQQLMQQQYLVAQHQHQLLMQKSKQTPPPVLNPRPQPAAPPPPPLSVDILSKIEFDSRLNQSCDANGVAKTRAQKINQKFVDYYTLFYVVLDFGGFEKASTERTWKAIAERMQILAPVSAPGALRKYYSNYLLAFEKELYPNAKDYKGANPRFIPPGIIGPEVEVPAPTPTASWQTPQVGQAASNPANPMMSAGSAMSNEQRQRMAPVAPSVSRIPNKPHTPVPPVAGTLMAPPRANSVGLQNQQQLQQIQKGFMTYGQRPGISSQMANGRTNLLDASPAIADVDPVLLTKKYGGIEVDKIYSVVPRVKKVNKNNLGAVDLYNIAMSLQSPSPIEIAYSLNVLTVLSNDKDVILRFPDFPPLGYAAINLLKTTIASLEELNCIPLDDEFIPIRTLLHFESATSACTTANLFSINSLTGSHMDKRKAYLERLVAILTVFRNLSAATVENQQWLGKNGGYFQAVVDALRISPFEPVDDDADAVEDGDSVFDAFGLDDDDDIFLDDVLGSEGAGKKEGSSKDRQLLFQDASTLILEVRRIAYAALLNISLHVQVSTPSNAQTIIRVISDALQTHADFLESHHHGPQLAMAWSKDPPSNRHLGEDLQPWMLLEGFNKLTIDIKNADLFAECQGELDSLLTVCVKVLPQHGGWPPNGTVDDSVCWELALSCLYHLVVMLDGAPGEVEEEEEQPVGRERRGVSPAAAVSVVTPVTHDRPFAYPPRGPSSQKQCSFSKCPMLVPLLLSLMRKPSLPSNYPPNSSIEQQFHPMCVKASRIFVEALQRGGDDARRVVKPFESSFVGMGISGAMAGVSDDVWRKVGEVLFLMNDEEET
ncbi:hypothetical protein BDR26DRAFT_1012967 [Obelidium mucronatum]|nr:hypothetical protein BDR26DRAFT_1012967 [Obelidium mucronatum]